MKKTELFFGTQKPDGTHVTGWDIQNFLEVNVTRYFTGFTVLESVGFWKGKEEKGFCVIVLHEGVKVTDKLIDKIRNEYKELFQQESVLRVDSVPESVSF